MSQEYDPFFDIPKPIIDKDEEALANRVKILKEYVDSPYNDENELETIDRRELITEEIKQIDAMCKHLNEPVFVSGTLTYSYFNEQTGQNEIATFIADDQLFIFEGFAAILLPDENGIDRQQVGQIFRFPSTVQIGSDSVLTQTITQYFAFAPYGAVTVEPGEYTQKETIDYLEQMIPGVLDDIDEVVSSADSAISAALRLRRVSVDSRHTPTDVVQALAGYVSSVVELNGVELFEVRVKNSLMIGLSDNIATYSPHDMSHPGGGSNTILAYFNGLSLLPYAGYVEGSMYQSTDYSWYLNGIVVDDKNFRSGPKDFRIAIADIVDIQSVGESVSNRWDEAV
jgi:hypothetical protein